ncbi:MAG: four helix bundle protein [Gemmatimonadota bacterium]
MPTKPSEPDKPHLRLKAWVACYDLTLSIHRSTRSWPAEGARELIGETRSAALGATIRVAEGVDVRGAREFRRLLEDALGCLARLSCLLMLAHDLEYLGRAELTALEVARDHAARLVGGLSRALTRKAADSTCTTGGTNVVPGD